MLTIESTRTCGQTPRLLFLLEELGEPYALVLREESYFETTMGRPGPVVRDGDFVFRHAIAAFFHLARTRGGGRLMPSDAERRVRVEEWIQDAWMGLGMCIRMLIALQRSGAPDAAARGPILGALRALDVALGDRAFVIGDELTAADCALSGIERLGGLVDLSPFPAVRRYGAELTRRPAFVRAERALAGVAQPAEVLRFWFESPARTEQEVLQKIRRWFLDGHELDADVRARFGATVAAAMEGRLEDWADTPEGALALVIVLDQLARHALRDDPRAFEGSDLAVRVALAAIERGDLEELEDAAERSFLASPLHHAEDLALQRRHEALAQDLARTAPPHYRALGEAAVEQSGKWRAIIERFGRFPHRNAILGRTTTPDEAAFLETFAAQAPPKMARALGVSA